MQIIQTQIAHRKLDKPVSWILNGFSDNAQLLTKEIQWFVVILQIIQIQIAHKKLEKQISCILKKFSVNLWQLNKEMQWFAEDKKQE